MPIITVGYGQDSFGAFAKRLQSVKVAVVVDVRTNPYSKYDPSYRQGQIEGFLLDAAIQYRFLGDKLGGKPIDQELYDSRGRIMKERLIATPSFQQGLDDVIHLSSNQVVALMCGCAKAMECHRGKIITPALEAKNLEILHMDPLGNLRSTPDQIVWEHNGQFALFGE